MFGERDINKVKKRGRVRVFRYKVYYESYIGEEPPSRCPFCGAPEGYLIPSEDWD